MAELGPLDDEIREWLATRPPVIKEMFAKKPGNLMYRNKTTGQYVFIRAYNENGTVTVAVSAEFNRVLDFEREVFGVPLDALEECDIPFDRDPNRKPLITEIADVEEYCRRLRDAGEEIEGL